MSWENPLANRNDFRAPDHQPVAGQIDNGPLDPWRLQMVVDYCKDHPGVKYAEARRKVLAQYPRERTPLPETNLSDRLPVADGQAITHLQDTVNGQPSSVVTQAELPQVNNYRKSGHAGYDAAVERMIHAERYALIKQDVPSAHFARKAQEAKERADMFSRLVRAHAESEGKKGRRLTYAMAKAECIKMARS